MSRRTFSSADRGVIDSAIDFANERLNARRIDKDSIVALSFALVEAIGNVVRHAAGKAYEFTVEIGFDRSTVCICVVDHGPGFRMRPAPMPPALDERGRGVPLMQRLCDSVEYHQGSGGNRLVLKKRFKTRDAQYGHV
jgi:anti-sigma regulatory factor (Ser/Thr protein kinase)